ncbi:MAG TPA: YdeI/OmpD-associated family protein [Rhodanobacter sp.]
MASHDPRIDAYIAKSAPFAQPILDHLRELVHTTCPEVDESTKWNMPFFSYKGSPICMMAAFKQHCGFGFWLSRQIVDGTTDGDANESMGQFGRLTAVADLPPKKQLAAFIKKAMALNEAGVKLRRPKTVVKPAPSLPDELAAQFKLKKNTAARASYEAFSPSMQREYVEWIAGAKTDATRQKRIATTLEWLAEGKPRNRKYEK